MSTKTVSIRRARPDDIGMLSAVFEAAWREAYQGVIPGVALQKFIAKRGPSAWRGMIGRGRGLAAMEFGDQVVAYAAYGRSRDRTLTAEGEVDELYVAPEYQGIGLGSRLFRAVRNDLADHGLARVGVWALADNDRARAFYEALGGRPGPEAIERVSGACLPKVAYIFG
ncbi:GNAT family N-acetyltransferase [Methylobacterium gnaphalii]|uniref:N-acetyltransferase GCN5 n=1 Tax=Methylobacterium gnaphalii TaxID=1010610 RepID=A0A512JNW4_9HYPH|nr:GNAT family N-acetyltransferase [Methylobacterium gnaphalii]GEP11650.1 N-acetyltransferase GCN5 [Methylobacterium gnaphalii]GJD69549.1 Mycothiol acetyltransferase [Methylobacterium gnaphalii]GLS49087.1 N-acetyltransferase GCN5 [Methylobacterium gnaphalii]